jgi:hypothetical protein
MLFSNVICLQTVPFVEWTLHNLFYKDYNTFLDVQLQNSVSGS